MIKRTNDEIFRSGDSVKDKSVQYAIHLHENGTLTSKILKFTSQVYVLQQTRTSKNVWCTAKE